jgi:hypothetical protein
MNEQTFFDSPAPFHEIEQEAKNSSVGSKGLNENSLNLSGI